MKRGLNPESPKEETTTPPVSEPDLSSIEKQSKPEDASKENYDMFMLQRVKALQQVNPALKALIDLQGKLLGGSIYELLEFSCHGLYK